MQWEIPAIPTEDMVTYLGWKTDRCKENDFFKTPQRGYEQNCFNCHTDITIPYDELDKITVIRKDGTTEDIISMDVLCSQESKN